MDKLAQFYIFLLGNNADIRKGTLCTLGALAVAALIVFVPRSFVSPEARLTLLYVVAIGAILAAQWLHGKLIVARARLNAAEEISRDLVHGRLDTAFREIAQHAYDAGIRPPAEPITPTKH